MTKEYILKRFEFDLNTDAFRSSYLFSRTSPDIIFQSNNFVEIYSMIDVLIELEYNCSFELVYSKLSRYKIICINTKYKVYDLYTDFQWYGVYGRYITNIEINKIPNYILSYNFSSKEGETKYGSTFISNLEK